MKDINSCYRESIRDAQDKIRLLNQSISSYFLTRRERDSQFMPNEKLITLDGVYEEIISFDAISEVLLNVSRNEKFRQKMMEYIKNPLNS